MRSTNGPDAPPRRASASAWKIRPGWYEVVLRLDAAAVATDGRRGNGGGGYIADQLSRMRHFRKASFAAEDADTVRFDLEVLARSVAAADSQAREALQDLLFGDAASGELIVTTLKVAWLSGIDAES